MSTLIATGELSRNNLTQGEFKTNIEAQRQYIEDALIQQLNCMLIIMLTLVLTQWFQVH